ncbi:family 78 glycoside hydrolase catalytic domain [Paenibacillus sacheonensis]|uniref:alpha-L-rhamnosidase n=1 Tax=Paenibacillus sacheonensis TaxID=742054 RepID=A0A7X4YUL7_9BACL|nr:family 78 glycoside hydrolase catalytic domain [Paenibacillus sacheonensis]MBM7567255.1 alpha-L-rhamnosidase [Paenibacillus sacheonensis]NBC72850.1 family 78 glycoside hydrolase catalytic domain [Paenibacillus sacheonensis]
MMHIYDLRVEYRNNPLGIDERAPRFSWKVAAGVRGWNQSACRIVVGRTPESVEQGAGEAWDSGRTSHAGIGPVIYAGEPLLTGCRYYWKVKVWDESWTESEWSETAQWEMGLLLSEDWQGGWIGYAGEPAGDKREAPAPLLRTEFRIDRAVAKARLYVSALGYAELSLNGRKIGDRLLDPALTDYSKRSLYATHDVTELLAVGEHCLGAELGRGFYGIKTPNVWEWEKAPWNGEPKLLLQLNVEYEDGGTFSLVSDDGWRANVGPTLSDSLYCGETYDARLELTGWNRHGFDAAGWHSVETIPRDARQLQAQTMPPIRVIEEIRPVSIAKNEANHDIVDFGRMLAGNVRIRVQGPAGTTVRISYGETLADNGAVNVQQDYIHDRIQTDTYILSGDGEETWSPSFSYKGFRYVELEGWPGVPSADGVTALAIRTDLELTGGFRSSSDLFNDIYKATVTTFMNNAHGIPTDTPVYEKNGWTGDAQLLSESTFLFADIQTFWEKWSTDLADSQGEDGFFPLIVPSPGWGQMHSPEWQCSRVFVPMAIYRHSGDERLLRRHYAGMRAYAEAEILTLTEDGLSSSVLGDWVPPWSKEWTPPEGAQVTSSAYVYRILRTMADIARIIGEERDAERYDGHAEAIRDAINRVCFRPEPGIYETDRDAGYRQVSSILPLAFGITENSDVPAVLANLVEDVAVTRDGHLNTGILGTKFLLPLLTAHGFGELAFRVADNRTYPGWGFWFENGANSLWEMWELNARSRNHYMFGTIVDWFMGDLAGIKPDEPAYRRFTVRPFMAEGLSFAEGKVSTVYGELASAWERTADGYTHTLTVPSNTNASVRFFAGRHAISENGVPIDEVDGVVSVEADDRATMAVLGSGTYSFTVLNA